MQKQICNQEISRSTEVNADELAHAQNYSSQSLQDQLLFAGGLQRPVVQVEDQP